MKLFGILAFPVILLLAVACGGDSATQPPAAHPGGVADGANLADGNHGAGRAGGRYHHYGPGDGDTQPHNPGAYTAGLPRRRNRRRKSAS